MDLSDSQGVPVCYICHEEESAERPFLPQGQECDCRGSNVIHDACFDDVLRLGHQSCSLCRQRWRFLPAEQQRTYVLHGHTYVETWHERDGRRHGQFICTVDGVRHMEGSYRHGILDSWLRVYEIGTGLLKRAVFYEDGLKNYVGMHYREGRLVYQARYYKGVRHGNTLYYARDGSYGRLFTYYYGRRLSAGS